MKTHISSLSTKRPVFYSEADFQHALAWEIHTQIPDAKIRPEFPAASNGTIAYIDILSRQEKTITAIELKYKTRKADIEHDGESFHLLNQSARDHGRYAFIKDISRLETFVALNPDSIGYAILITNDQAYWKPAVKPDAIDTQFLINHDRTISQTMAWSGNFSAGSVSGRISPIELAGNYKLQWFDYSNFPDVRYGKFRCLIVAIDPTTQQN